MNPDVVVIVDNTNTPQPDRRRDTAKVGLKEGAKVLGTGMLIGVISTVVVVGAVPYLAVKGVGKIHQAMSLKAKHKAAVKKQIKKQMRIDEEMAKAEKKLAKKQAVVGSPEHAEKLAFDEARNEAFREALYQATERILAERMAVPGEAELANVDPKVQNRPVEHIGDVVGTMVI